MRYLSNVATLDFVADKCNGCGRCVEVCPHGVFSLVDKRAYVADRDLCMECGACVKNCLTGALSVVPGVGCASAIIGGMIKGTEPVCGCDADESKDAGGAGGGDKGACC
jgi:NAD-dependent dihydropyrimidine dehydrogenase PreA subunit